MSPLHKINLLYQCIHFYTIASMYHVNSMDLIMQIVHVWNLQLIVIKANNQNLSIKTVEYLETLDSLSLLLSFTL